MYTSNGKCVRVNTAFSGFKGHHGKIRHGCSDSRFCNVTLDIGRDATFMYSELDMLPECDTVESVKQFSESSRDFYFTWNEYIEALDSYMETCLGIHA